MQGAVPGLAGRHAAPCGPVECPGVRGICGGPGVEGRDQAVFVARASANFTHSACTPKTAKSMK